MKASSPRLMAIIIALISAVISCILAGVTFLSVINDYWIYIIVLFLLIFIIIHFISYFLLKKFFIDKIKPIYKTINSFNLNAGVLNENIYDKDVVSILKDDVVEWIKNRTNEISELKQSEKYRKEFLGNVSHELKTPIFNIQGYILTLLDGGLYDESINKNYLERTEKSVERLISIVEDLEAITRLEAGELELKYENFSILNLTNDVFDHNEINAKRKNVQLRINPDCDKQVSVYADKQQIYQVINNLVSNSIKYGKENGYTSISFYNMDPKILIEVEDNGLGIPENSIPRIFERFYRVDKSRSRDQGGTGLGLAIVKHIIEAHNQTVTVKSKHGEGSSFTFTLQKTKK